MNTQMKYTNFSDRKLSRQFVSRPNSRGAFSINTEKNGAGTELTGTFYGRVRCPFCHCHRGKDKLDKDINNNKNVAQKHKTRPRKTRRNKREVGKGRRPNRGKRMSMSRMNLLNAVLAARRGSERTNYLQESMTVRCFCDCKKCAGTTQDRSKRAVSKGIASCKGTIQKGSGAVTAAQSIGMDVDDRSGSTGSKSLPYRRRRTRRTSMDELTHKLKTTADFVSSNNNERVQLLEIAMTPFEVCMTHAVHRAVQLQCH